MFDLTTHSLGLISPLEVAPLATSLADWFNAQFADAGKVIKNALMLVFTVFVAYRAVKAGFGLGAIVGVALAAAVCYWLVIGGGIADIGKLISDQSNAGLNP